MLSGKNILLFPGELDLLNKTLFGLKGFPFVLSLPLDIKKGIEGFIFEDEEQMAILGKEIDYRVCNPFHRDTEVVEVIIADLLFNERNSIKTVVVGHTDLIKTVSKRLKDPYLHSPSSEDKEYFIELLFIEEENELFVLSINELADFQKSLLQ